jgi:hypothetical protein
MRTVRRLYFYLVAFISLEVVMWSIITLARTLFDASTLNNIGDQIAGGLAFLIVGLPIFLFHWFFIQRDISHDAEERSSRLRELFLYGIFLATLIPIAQNVIALLNRITIHLFELDNTFAFLGSNQTVADNLIAISVMIITFAYFRHIVQNEWTANTTGNDLPGTRRLFRYIWMLYSLALVVFSVVFILQYIFEIPTGFGNPTRELLANGVAITLVATPLWVFNWRVIQNSLVDREEILSYLRLVILYLLALGGIITTLSCAGIVIATFLRVILQKETFTAAELLNQISSTLSITIPMGVIWGYFGREWNNTIAEESDPLRKDALRRLYFYILSLLGNIAVFAGIQQLLTVMIDILLGHSAGLANYADSISNALSMLIIGLPVWLRYWPGLQSQASRTDEAGDHARRSVIRKSYLYLALFSLVVGMMASAGILLYNLISTITVNNPGNPMSDFLYDSKTLCIVVIWLVYHFMALRGDGRAAQAALSDQHSAYPTLMILEDDPEYGQLVAEKLKQIAPKLPLTVMESKELSKDSDLGIYKAIVLPVGLMTRLARPHDQVLDKYTGKRIILPEAKINWIWQGVIRRGKLDSAKETARIIRMLAENQEIHPASTSGSLMILAYVLAGLFSVQLLFMIIGLIVSSFIH